MSYKIYTKGNYFYIIDNDNNREYNALSKNVEVTRGTTAQDDFFIENVPNWRGTENPLDISEIQDVNGDAYVLADFITFYENNTGLISSISENILDYNTEVALGNVIGSELWNKWGYNDDIDIGTEVLASWGGTFEPLTTPTTISIVSDSVNDIATTGTGVRSLVVYDIDENRNDRITVIPMNGTTANTDITNSLGIDRMAMFLCGSGKVNAGTITATAVTGGSIMAQMPTGQGVTQQCIFHVPANAQFITEWLYINVLNRGKAAELQVKLWVYSPVNNGKQEVFRVNIDTQVTNTIDINPNLPFPISEKSVIWLEVTSDKNDVEVTGRFSGVLKYE